MRATDDRRRPAWFLRVAGTFALLYFALGVCAVLMIGASQSVFAPYLYPPDDDDLWLRTAVQSVPWARLTALQGATREKVLDDLGPPLHTRRQSWGRAQVWLYRSESSGSASPVAQLHFDDGGRVAYVLGRPGSFQLTGYLTREAELLLWFICNLVMAVPTALYLGLFHALRRPRFREVHA